MITHKFREVSAYADDVTVLRKGRLVGSTAVAQTSTEQLALWMMGQADTRAFNRDRPAVNEALAPRLELRDLEHYRRQRHAGGFRSVAGCTAGEIVGIAGVSGNGQRELTEALLGQRRIPQRRNPRQW